MQRAHMRTTYTGYPAAAQLGPVGHHHPGGAGHGFCGGCGHPRASCCCGCRECRKEAKEVLVEPTQTQAQLKENTGTASAFARISVLGALADTAGEGNPDQILGAADIRAGKIGLQTAFIGGGCCVHLSIEYVPAGTADGLVGVLVQDSHDTELMWIKKAQAALGYQIKEGIITTKPGAHLTAIALGATARVRWCEVFSC